MVRKSYHKFEGSIPRNCIHVCHYDRNEYTFEESLKYFLESYSKYVDEVEGFEYSVVFE